MEWAEWLFISGAGTQHWDVQADGISRACRHTVSSYVVVQQLGTCVHGHVVMEGHMTCGWATHEEKEGLELAPTHASPVGLR